MGKNICSGCDLTFGSVGAFNAHRVGGYGDPIYKQSPTGKSQDIVGYTPSTRRCLTIEEMVAQGFKQEKHGWWVIDTMDEAAHARLKARKQKIAASDEDTEEEFDEDEESA